MRINTISLSLALLLLAGIATAQREGKIVFETLSHDFGKIAPSQTELRHTFRYVNKGRAPISITKVRPSCNCTASKWTQTPVAVKDSGMVEITLNPAELDGQFTKYITLLTDGVPQAVLLKVSGEKQGQKTATASLGEKKSIPAADLSRSYPKKLGSLQASDGSIFFGDVAKNETATQQVTFYNPTNRPIRVFPDKSTVPEHITMQLEEELIRPQDSLQILLTFSESKRKDWGYVHSSAFIATDDPQEPRKRLSLSARIIEDFSNWKEGDPRPVAALNKSKHEFGALVRHSTVAASFTLSNKGNAPLHIRKTKASCGCTASAPQKNTLKPGEATEVKVTFRSGSSTGYQRKSITIITNDPKQPEMLIWIEAQVN